jgi:GT2 family glycosyltransferase
MVKRFLDQQNKIDESIDSLGILTPVLLNLDLTYQAQGGSFPTLISLFFHMSMMDDLPLVGKFFPSTQHSGKTSRLNLEKLEHSNKLIPVDWVGGTAMMIAKKVLDNIGPFDQNIFMYGEDTEICMRARDHHYKVALDPTAKIIHLQNKSSSSQNAIMGEFKGYLYIFSKHQTTFQTEIAKILLQIGALIRIFVFSFIAPNIDKTKIYKKVLADIS